MQFRLKAISKLHNTKHTHTHTYALKKIGIDIIMEPHTNDIWFMPWYLRNNINLLSRDL
jgi:hypothetical protein